MPLKDSCNLTQNSALMPSALYIHYSHTSPCALPPHTPTGGSMSINNWLLSLISAKWQLLLKGL